MARLDFEKFLEIRNIEATAGYTKIAILENFQIFLNFYPMRTKLCRVIWKKDLKRIARTLL